MLLDDDVEPDAVEVASRRRQRLTVLGGSVLVTAILLGLVLALGDWAYRYRQHTLHHGRLQRLVAAQPRVAEVTAALVAEGGRPVAGIRLTAGQEAEIAARRARWPDVRVFTFGAMSYVLFFDGQGVLRDFVLASP